VVGERAGIKEGEKEEGRGKREGSGLTGLKRGATHPCKFSKVGACAIVFSAKRNLKLEAK